MSDLMYRSYDKYSDDLLAETLEFKKSRFSFINRDYQWVSAQFLDKEIACIETIIRQRIKDKALKDYYDRIKSDNEAKIVETVKVDDQEDCGDEYKTDDEVSPQPQPIPLPQPLLYDKIAATSPSDIPIPDSHPSPPIVPDILAPSPFPPSPNIRYTPNRLHAHPPLDHPPLDICTPSPHPHPPDILPPLPLPLKPNIPVH
jgi:hypothetical protein